MEKSLDFIRNNQSLVVFLYKYICKIYQVFSTLYENIFFRKLKPKNNFLNTGIFTLQNCKNSFLEKITELDTLSVNQYLSIRLMNHEQLDNLVHTVFNKELRNQITEITGFSYSVDFMIFYDRKFIPEELRKVPTLKQAYSYRWHFDKPNSRNMLKIFIPMNISNDHGPLEVIDKEKSKQIRGFKNINLQQAITFLTGEKNTIYGFQPTICCHRDGIPSNENVATQIMFQLNPKKRWSINLNLDKRNPDLNNKLKIWTNEPKFSFLTCMNDKRKYF